MVDTEIPYLISNQKCAMSRSGGVCLSADFARVVCRWVHMMWRKTCFLVRGGACLLRSLPTSLCTSPHPRYLDADHAEHILTAGVASHSGAHRQYLIWGPCHLSASKLPPWQSLSPACSWCPRNVKLVMASVVTMVMIRRK